MAVRVEHDVNDERIGDADGSRERRGRIRLSVGSQRRGVERTQERLEIFKCRWATDLFGHGFALPESNCLVSL
jgi:hypothetical protein